MSSYRRKTDTLPTCMNCGAVLYGVFCSQCGQRSAEPIRWQRAVAETGRRLRTLDFCWVRTVAALTVDPGRMIRRYLRGRRIPYVSPPLYAIGALAIFLAVVLWQRPELTAPGTPWSVLPDHPASPVHGSALEGEQAIERPADSTERLGRTVFALCAMSSLLVAALTALVQSKLYAGHDFTWVETYVFELFVLGQLALHQTLFALLGAFASKIGLLSLAVVFVLFLAFALSGFYRRSLTSSLPAALLLATVQVAGVFVVGSFVRIALRG
ncbi:MAG: DUF3667 domain-containing protein [Thermoanaerobaculia bacterium]|nr:DUF3667 domain-containing protein [Thermoanaerobaculia bacterium]